MKKVLVLILLALCAVSLVACGEKTEAKNKELTVAATLDPHSKILEFAKPILKDKYGIDLKIRILDDYYIFNKSLVEGEIDANYFQHLPFFNNEVEANNYDIANIAGIHIEPFGFYSKKITDLSELADNAEIIISNSVADHGRLLSVLSDAGIITLKDGSDAITATLEDIVENSKNLVFKEVKPELLTVAYENDEGDLVAINGNYAIQIGLNPSKDAVILESSKEDNPFVNILACRKEDVDNSNIQKLVEVLKSQEVKEFILKEYSNGSVIPAE